MEGISLLSRGIFSDGLKLANTAPVHKKDEATDRPLSVLPLFSRIFENFIYVINLVNIWKNT